tara:strand:+ start:263 stop:502 length:240 start_codon:yes stop_codon:yes gene_type:complete
MRALCLITIKPGTIDKVTKSLLKKHNMAKEVMPVTGRADICVILQGSMNEIDIAIMGFTKKKDIVSTETLIETEVDMGW